MDAVVRLAAIQQSRHSRKGAGVEGGGGGGRTGGGGASNVRPWARHIMGAALSRSHGACHDFLFFLSLSLSLPPLPLSPHSGSRGPLEKKIGRNRHRHRDSDRDRDRDQGLGNSSMVEGGDVEMGVGGSAGGAWEWGQGRRGFGGGRRSLLRADDTGRVHEVPIVETKL